MIETNGEPDLKTWKKWSSNHVKSVKVLSKEMNILKYGYLYVKLASLE